MITDYIAELADAIHRETCEVDCTLADCPRYHGRTRHYDYYLNRAKTLFDALAPLIGSANVKTVVVTVVDELL